MLGKLPEDWLSYGLLSVRRRAHQTACSLRQDARIIMLAETHEHGECKRMAPSEPADRTSRFSAHGLRRVTLGQALQFRQN